MITRMGQSRRRSWLMARLRHRKWRRMWRRQPILLLMPTQPAVHMVLRLRLHRTQLSSAIQLVGLKQRHRLQQTMWHVWLR